MNMYSTIFLLALLLPLCNLAPVKKPAPEETKDNTDWMKDLHYKEYLAEVMKELESDPEFKKHVANSANQSEIALGLEMVHHKVRNRLDELKRIEIERLNKVEHALELIKEKGDKADLHFLSKYDREHLDHENPHTFEVADLQKLIDKIHKDLSKIDQKEDEEYKHYEMEKEHERQERLRKAKDAEEKAKLQQEYEESQKRHRKHEELHHPGSEEQLKEAWEDIDHLDPKDYNPKSIFKLHDLNGDGRWDEAEIEAIMQAELDKVYSENDTDDDLNERYHEMARMRREMMEEADANNDSVIDAAEFDKWTNSPKYKHDDGWKTEEEMDHKPYTDEEFQAFEKELEHAEGTPPPPPPSQPPQAKQDPPANANKAPADPQVVQVDSAKSNEATHKKL